VLSRLVMRPSKELPRAEPVGYAAFQGTPAC
jgi:hypothetical protein